MCDESRHLTSKAAAPIAEVESHPKDGSQTPAEILPGVWLERDESWERRRRPIRVKLSPTRQGRAAREGRGLNALMGKPVC